MPDPDGLVTATSKHPPKETADRLAKAAEARGMTVLARIDHAAAAKHAGLELRPTEVLMFGNPKGGTPLMQATQTIGIDLPLKALVWEDDHQVTRLSYNDPHWLAARHGISGNETVLAAMASALSLVAKEATDGS